MPQHNKEFNSHRASLRSAPSFELSLEISAAELRIAWGFGCFLNFRRERHHMRRCDMCRTEYETGVDHGGKDYCMTCYTHVVGEEARKQRDE